MATTTTRSRRRNLLSTSCCPLSTSPSEPAQRLVFECRLPLLSSVACLAVWLCLAGVWRLPGADAYASPNELFKNLTRVGARTTAYLMYRQENKIVTSANNRPYLTLLAPTDYAWYTFFMDYQKGSVHIEVPPGIIQASFMGGLEQYSTVEFATLMQGMIDSPQPGFADFCVSLLNHMIVIGNYSFQNLKLLKPEDMLATGSAFPIHVKNTHPVTFKAVAQDVDTAVFSRQRELDPMYIPRMIKRLSAVIEQNVYKETKLIIHVVDNVLPIIDMALVDPPVPLPPGYKTTPNAAVGIRAAWLTVVLAVLFSLLCPVAAFLVV